jgi:hypothetical protein
MKADYVVGRLYTVAANTLTMSSHDGMLFPTSKPKIHGRFVKGDVMMFVGEADGENLNGYDFVFYRFLTSKGILGRLSRDNIHEWVVELK